MREEARRWIGAHRAGVAVLAGACLPLVVAALLVPFRATFADAAASLVLVAVVTAVATTGTRPAGYVAALSASLWFDFFLTRPYDRLMITRRPDIEITVSLLVVGIVITELAATNRNHRQRAVDEASYVDLLYHVSELVVAGRPFDDVFREVQLALIELLHLRDCRFEPGDVLEPHRIRRDGRVILGTMEWPVSVWGLPGREIALPILDRGRAVGRMILVPTPGQPVTRQRRLVAIALADQLGPLVQPRLRIA